MLSPIKSPLICLKWKKPATHTWGFRWITFKHIKMVTNDGSHIQFSFFYYVSKCKWRTNWILCHSTGLSSHATHYISSTYIWNIYFIYIMICCFILIYINNCYGLALRVVKIKCVFCHIRSVEPAGKYCRFQSPLACSFKHFLLFLGSLLWFATPEKSQWTP